MPTSPIKPIKTIRDQIADQLRNEILAHEHESDAPMREEALAERFGTSRGPVRDVLLQLTQEGVLVYRPNAGVRISAPPDAETRTLLMDLRKRVELHALPRFIAGLTEEDEEALRDILEAMKSACRRRDMPDIVGSDMALHRYIVRRGASPEVEKVWMNLAVRILMAYSRLVKHMDIHKEHVRIVDAICSRDLKAASAALESNLI
jgi:GntR family transcriptional regulator, rspAB operon transcriptional repressor